MESPAVLRASVPDREPDLRALAAAAQHVAVDEDRGRPAEVGREDVLDLRLDVVPEPRQLAADRDRDAGVDLEALALVVDARPARRLLGAVTVVDDVDEGLHDRAHDPAPARRAEREEGMAAAQDHRGRARPQHALAGRDRVRPSRPRVEPVEAVRQQQARPLRHEARAEPPAERRRERHEHPVAVDGAYLRRVRRIGERAEPLGERGAEGERDLVQAPRRELRAAAEVDAREQLERARDGRPAREAGQGEDAVSAVVHDDRRELAGAVCREIVAREDPARVPNVVDDRGRELAAIQDLRAALGHELEGARELGLANELRGLESGLRPVRGAAGPVIHVLRLGVAMEARRVRPEKERAVPVADETVGGEADRRLEEAAPRQLAEAAMRQLVRGHRTGDRDGERSLDVHVALHAGPAERAVAGVACGEFEQVRPRRDRINRLSVERARVAVARDDKPGDPAEAASDRRGHAEGERGRECRVQRVPAFAQELDAGLGRARIRGDHAFGRDRLGPREDPLAPLCHDQPGTGAPTKISWGPGGVAPDDGGRSPDFCTLRCLPMDVADLLAFKTVPDVQLSPDGHRVAFVVSEIDVERDEYRSAIWVLAADGGRPLRFTRGPKRDSAPRWSPDGEHLAFLSDREDEKPQLYVMPAAGGEPRKLTSLDAGASAATWSPDSRRIAFSARVWLEPPPA